MESEITTKICDSISIVVVIIHTKFQLHWMFETDVRWVGHFCPLSMIGVRTTLELIGLSIPWKVPWQFLDRLVALVGCALMRKTL